MIFTPVINCVWDIRLPIMMPHGHYAYCLPESRQDLWPSAKPSIHSLAITSQTGMHMCFEDDTPTSLFK